MKKKLVLFSLLIAFTFLINGQLELYKLHKDIQYKKPATEYEKERCRLDVYLPVKVKNFPVLVWFHGGAIKFGDKSGNEVVKVAKHLTANNIGVVTVNYRLNPKVKFPEYINDAAASIVWVKKNIAKYNGNSDLIFVGGHSAGSYLTAMAVLDRNFLNRYLMSSEDIAGIILLSGQMNSHFTVKAERGIPRSKIIIDNTAPKFYAKKAEIPCLILVAEKDNESTKNQNSEFFTLLKNKNQNILEYFEVPGQDHMTTVQLIDNPDNRTGKHTISFIKKICKKNKNI